MHSPHQFLIRQCLYPCELHKTSSFPHLGAEICGEPQQLLASCAVLGSILVVSTCASTTKFIASCILSSCLDGSHTGICLSFLQTRLMLCQDISLFLFLSHLPIFIPTWLLRCVQQISRDTQTPLTSRMVPSKYSFRWLTLSPPFYPTKHMARPHPRLPPQCSTGGYQ